MKKAAKAAFFIFGKLAFVVRGRRVDGDSRG